MWETHTLSRATWDEDEGTVSPLSCFFVGFSIELSPQHNPCIRISILGSTLQELTSYNHKHVSVRFKGILPFSPKIFERCGECQLLLRNGSWEKWWEGKDSPIALLWAGAVGFLSGFNCLPEIPWLVLCWTNIHRYIIFWNFLGKVKAFHMQFS